MIIKKMTYTDYDGIERTETFHFNLRKEEVIQMTLGGLEHSMRHIMETQNMKEIVSFIENLVQKSYGQKSADGRKFVKSKELLDDFISTEAYSDLIVELVSDADKMSAFFRGVMPPQLQKDILATTPEVIVN